MQWVHPDCLRIGRGRLWAEAEGMVALVKQKNGKYRIIVSRPPNAPDGILARAEQALVELVEEVTPCSLFKDEDDFLKDKDEDDD